MDEYTGEDDNVPVQQYGGNLWYALVYWIVRNRCDQLTTFPSVRKALDDHGFHEGHDWTKVTVGQFAELIWLEDKYWPSGTNGRHLKHKVLIP